MAKQLTAYTMLYEHDNFGMIDMSEGYIVVTTESTTECHQFSSNDEIYYSLAYQYMKSEHQNLPCMTADGRLLI